MIQYFNARSHRNVSIEEHDVYLPMVVLEELDNHKTGLSEVARNVRQTNRMLVELMSNVTHEQIVAGLSIPSYLK